MPYIPPGTRAPVTPQVERDPCFAGELNFQLTMLCRNYLRQHGLCYSTINDIIGALEGAKMEFYRRVAAPYEDQKITQNGDVYP